MLELGWLNDKNLPVGGGTFCRACAHDLRIARMAEHCTWCKLLMVEEEQAELEGWAYYTDPLGALHPCCPVCLAKHFGITARITLHEA